MWLTNNSIIVAGPKQACVVRDDTVPLRCRPIDLPGTGGPENAAIGMVQTGKETCQGERGVLMDERIPNRQRQQKKFKRVQVLQMPGSGLGLISFPATGDTSLMKSRSLICRHRLEIGPNSGDFDLSISNAARMPRLCGAFCPMGSWMRLVPSIGKNWVLGQSFCGGPRRVIFRPAVRSLGDDCLVNSG